MLPDTIPKLLAQQETHDSDYNRVERWWVVDMGACRTEGEIALRVAGELMADFSIPLSGRVVSLDNVYDSFLLSFFIFQC